jgi:hypothetical protein
MPVNVVRGCGHDLGKQYVGTLLDRWLVGYPLDPETA